MIFHWSLGDCKSLQVSRILLSILANLNNAVVLTISTRPVISKSSSLCTNPLVTVPRAPITFIITVTLMFHFFFQFQNEVQVLILSHIHVFSCEMSLFSRLKRPSSCFFFPLLFSGYCHSVSPRVVNIVSGDCNQSSFELFYVVFELLCRCINAVFNDGKTYSSLSS